MTNIPMNPVLAKLHGDGVTNVTAFRGYVGPGTTEAHIRLYPSLDDLSRSVEIARADILHFEEVPEALLPFGAITAWVKKDAQLTTHSAETTAAGVKAEKDLIEVNRGRLRILVRRGLASDDCSSDCSSRCDCQSRCRAVEFGTLGELPFIRR